MPDAITTTPLVDRLRAQAARHREHATGLASAALLEEAADEIERGLDARAVDYVLSRLQADGFVAYLLGWGTEAFSRLTAAAAARSGEEVDELRRRIWKGCRPIRVRDPIGAVEAVLGEYLDEEGDPFDITARGAVEALKSVIEKLGG